MSHNAEPEWIGRKDIENGEWLVEDCEPRRGIPATAIVERVMRAPSHDTDQARVIRAHELMHSKVSPANEWGRWVDRKIATKEALTVAEELRVNFLCKKAGFDVEAYLTDGGEVADGERLACTNDWKACVFMAIATAGTASSKPFLTGVRRHNRLWGSALLDISKRAVKEMEKAHKTGRLGSTEVHKGIGFAPYGFIFSEKIAEWADRLAGMEPPQEEPESEESESEEQNSGGNEEPQKREHSNKGISKNSEKEIRERISSITPDRMEGQAPYWGQLNIENLPKPVVAKGGLGKKKSVSNVGRSPRRLHRYMTDPQRRIFDVKKRGLGGVVCIDASGSMAITHNDIVKILEASPGATVIAYSQMDSDCKETNAWILADKGRMVEQVPSMGQGNGVDFPALEWAVKHRQHSSAPVIWVTDGGTCGPNQGFSNTLANQCTKFCIEKRVITVETVEGAVQTLTRLSAGQTVTREFPSMLQHAWREKNGVRLPATVMR
jgi:hypothetical protein